MADSIDLPRAAIDRIAKNAVPDHIQVPRTHLHSAGTNTPTHVHIRVHTHVRTLPLTTLCLCFAPVPFSAPYPLLVSRKVHDRLASQGPFVAISDHQGCQDELHQVGGPVHSLPFIHVSLTALSPHSSYPGSKLEFLLTNLRRPGVFFTCSANDIAKANKRQTISSKDIHLRHPRVHNRPHPPAAPRAIPGGRVH